MIFEFNSINVMRGSNIFFIILDTKKEEKSLTDLVIERSYEVLGCTLDERSDENLKWMHKKGYGVKQAHKRGRARGRRR
jgi:hypothetical protein